MEFTGRIKFLIKVYNTLLNSISIVSPEKAARIAFQRFCTPYHGKPKRIAPEVFSKGENLLFQFDNLTIRGWKWKITNQSRKKVLIVHGFDSCSYKFDQYISPLNEKGYDVYAFDAPGHGISDGTTINGHQYANLIEEIEKRYGKFDCIMAHSLGALAAALAMENMDNQQQRKLVLIAPATETTTAVNNFFKYIKVNDKVKAAFNNHMYNIGKKTVSFYSVTRAICNYNTPTLWIHDKEDFICDFADTLEAQQAGHKHIQFHLTQGLGHSGIYRKQEVFDVVIQFL